MISCCADRTCPARLSVGALNEEGDPLAGLRCCLPETSGNQNMLLVASRRVGHEVEVGSFGRTGQSQSCGGAGVVYTVNSIWVFLRHHPSCQQAKVDTAGRETLRTTSRKPSLAGTWGNAASRVGGWGESCFCKPGGSKAGRLGRLGRVATHTFPIRLSVMDAPGCPDFQRHPRRLCHRMAAALIAAAEHTSPASHGWSDLCVCVCVRAHAHVGPDISIYLHTYIPPCFLGPVTYLPFCPFLT